MRWLFEWNLLGYTWAILIGGQLSMLAGMFAGELLLIWHPEEDHKGEWKVIDMLALSIICCSTLLSLMTIYFWNFRTALWLVVGACGMLVLIFGLGYGVMKLLGKSRQNHRSTTTLSSH